MCLLCSLHHKHHHDGLLLISGRAPDQLVFERRPRLELSQRDHGLVAPTWAQVNEDTELLARPPVPTHPARAEAAAALEAAPVDATLEMVVREGLRRLGPKQT